MMKMRLLKIRTASLLKQKEGSTSRPSLQSALVDERTRFRIADEAVVVNEVPGRKRRCKRDDMVQQMDVPL
jgi:hypothetical protein